MRQTKKYKYWLRIKSFFYPSRILKFKKSKWKLLKAYINKTKTKTKFQILNFNKFKEPIQKWFRLNAYFKNKILLKRQFLSRIDNNKINNLKIFKNKKNIVRTNFLKPYFRIDILLWKLNFFSSTYETQQYIYSNNVRLNNKTICSFKIFLKKGDIIILTKNIFKMLKKNIIKKEILVSFLEIDYYTQTIIILKNFNEIEENIVNLNLLEYYPLSIINEF